MKKLRFTTTLSMIALCTVLALAQDGGLGRGRGGGGGSSGGSSGGGRTSPPSTPPSSPPRSMPPSTGGGSGPSRDRSMPPTTGGGTRSGPPQDGGLGRGRGGGSGSGSGSGSGRDGGLGRGGGSSSGGSNSGGRDRGGSSTGNDGLGRDRGNSGGTTSTGRDRGDAFGRPSSGGNGGLGRARPENVTGRAGAPSYQGTNNVDGRSRDRASRQFTVGAPQSRGIIDANRFRAGLQFGPNGFVGGGLVVNGWRNGYCHYNPGWVDNWFWGPNYAFNPWTVNCVVSPFYWYPFVPGYLNFGSVVVVNSWRPFWNWNVGAVYVWDNGWNGWGGNSWGNDWNRRNVREVDYAIEDLQQTFERYDQRSLDRLVPQDGSIAILRDNRYDYSINAADFYDMMNDLAGNAQTRRYRIVEVRTNRDSARIQASHEYTDPWGNRQTVWHSFYLQQERGNMVIREFGTSNRRIW